MSYGAMKTRKCRSCGGSGLTIDKPPPGTKYVPLRMRRCAACGGTGRAKEAQR